MIPDIFSSFGRFSQVSQLHLWCLVLFEHCCEITAAACVCCQAAIRKELNEFKGTEMEVHEESKKYTRYTQLVILT